MTDPGEFFDVHPHPVFKIRSDHVIAHANEAAITLCGTAAIGQQCHSVLFGRKRPCVDCPLEPHCAPTNYVARAALGVRLTAQSMAEDSFITSTLYTNGDEHWCYECIHPLPALVVGTRAARGLADQVAAANTIENVLTVIREFLAGPTEKPRYRVRQYSLDHAEHYSALTCTWHDTPRTPDRTYVADLRGKCITRANVGSEDEVSFYSLDNFCIVLASPYHADWEFFRETYQAAQVTERAEVWEETPKVFGGLRLWTLGPTDGALRLFTDDDPHCWLDIPFGQRRTLVAKMSVTPLGCGGRFAREEMEMIALLQMLANLQIQSLLLRERDRRRVLLEQQHEARGPAFQALGSIQLLRDTDRARNGDVDIADFYLKKNIETAIRMVAFLNDAPNVSRSVPCLTSLAPQNLLGDVLAPIINLFRHNEFLQALNKKQLRTDDITEANLSDIVLPETDTDERKVAFNLGHQYDIHYSASLGTIALYVDAYRLQEIFYNLFMNASKYRGGKRFTLRIARRWDYEFISKVEHDLYAPFFLIDVEDNGAGIESSEATEIFALGTRGSAAGLNPGVGGTGRGLYIVREILLSLGGDIYVENLRRPTRFRLFLPAICIRPDWVQRLPTVWPKLAAVRSYLEERMPRS